MAERPVVLYDADCGFCRWSLAKLIGWDRRGRLRILPIASDEGQRLLVGLTEQERQDSWHFVGRDGDRHSAGPAAGPLLRELPGGRSLAALLTRFPGPTDAAYNWVSDHRSALAKLIPASTVRRADARISRR